MIAGMKDEALKVFALHSADLCPARGKVPEGETEWRGQTFRFFSQMNRAACRGGDLLGFYL
jgi:hypothetical protein